MAKEISTQSLGKLFENSEEFKKLNTVKNKILNNLDLTTQWQRFRKNYQKELLSTNQKNQRNNASSIFNQIEQQTQLLQKHCEKVKTFLDYSCGLSNGGFTTIVFKHLPQSKGIGVCFPNSLDSKSIPKLSIPPSEKRFQCISEDSFLKQPSIKNECQLVLLNGWDLFEEPLSRFEDTPQGFSSSEGRKTLLSAKQMMLLQLLAGFSSLSIGGHALVKLALPEEMFTLSVVVLLLDSFEKVVLIKPIIGGFSANTHLTNTTFYLLGLNYRNKNHCVTLGQVKKTLVQEGKDVASVFGDDDSWIKMVKKEQLISLFDPYWRFLSEAYTQFASPSLVQIPQSPLPINSSLQFVPTPQKPPFSPDLPKDFEYEYDLDMKGILFYLYEGDVYGEHPVSVSASSVGEGEPLDFIRQEDVRCNTQNVPYSWYCVDIGPDLRIIPTQYTMGYASSGSLCCPRFWIFQASNQITRLKQHYSPKDRPEDDPDWETLSIHNDDDVLSSEWATYTWNITTSKPFRYFRVVQTGPTSFNTQGITIGSVNDWSQTFVVGKFELYGTLQEAHAINPISMLGTTNPTWYGLAKKNNFVASEMIYADRNVTKELREMLSMFSKPSNESKAEKVEVHEIFAAEHENEPVVQKKTFGWSTITNSKDLTVSQDLNSFSRPTVGPNLWQVMVGNVVMDKGVWCWKIRLDQVDTQDTNTWKVCVGIMYAKPNLDCSNFDGGAWAGGKVEAFGMELGNGKLIHGFNNAPTQTVAQSDKKKGVRKGDKITLQLDMDQGILKYWINGKRIHPSCTVNTSSSVVPIVTVAGKYAVSLIWK